MESKSKSASGADYRRELAELNILFDISRILEKHSDLRMALGPLLDLLESKAGLSRGMVTLLDRSVGMLRIEEAHGLDPDEKKRGQYRLGEGIIGKVFESGNAVTVPDLSMEPQLLNRAGARARTDLSSLSFHCIPITSAGRVIGTLSAERRGSGDKKLSDTILDSDRSILERVARLIADSARLRERIMEEQLSHGSDPECDDALPEDLPRRSLPDASTLIGTSAPMRAIHELIAQVAPSDATVLIQGESGTGKELVAAEIHKASRRKNGPLIKVNCSALPESVIESELFGHEKGSFTGAVGLRKGRFELASGGTLFLDEIGELSASIQVKLLRVLQEREIERLGGSETIKVDVRLIAATNRNLEAEIKAGRFREDLYYRLYVFPILVPPLRERKSDIILLADHFTEKYSQKNDKPIKRISSPAIDLFMSYHWPGNVRELENCIERAVILSTDMVIHSYHLPPSLQSAQSTHTEPTTTLEAALSRLEKEMIVEALKISSGNMASAARQLGITERQIGLRVHHYGINWRQYRTTIM